jgi:hypothetical protein
MAPRVSGSRLHVASIIKLIECALVLCALSLAFAPGDASAWPPCQGNSCLPTTGYTIDETWNCGQIHSEVSCYFREVTTLRSATLHTWGFGSASYNGEGSVSVTIEAGTPELSYFGGTGTNLMRSCYELGCADQDSISMHEQVSNGGFHTIFGHGEA